MHGKVMKQKKESEASKDHQDTEPDRNRQRQGIPWWTGGPSVLPSLGLGFSPWLGSYDLHKLHSVTKNNI